jgi:hypothetical protein
MEDKGERASYAALSADYDVKIEQLMDMRDRLVAIRAQPRWRRWLYWRERRRLTQQVLELAADMMILGERMNAQLRKMNQKINDSVF